MGYNNVKCVNNVLVVNNTNPTMRALDTIVTHKVESGQKRTGSAPRRDWRPADKRIGPAGLVNGADYNAIMAFLKVTALLLAPYR